MPKFVDELDKKPSFNLVGDNTPEIEEDEEDTDEYQQPKEIEEDEEEEDSELEEDDSEEEEDLDEIFSLDLKEIPVKIIPRGKKEPENFVIRQLTGDQRDRYMNSMKNRMNFKGKEKTIRDFRGLQSDLLEMCLIHISADGKESSIKGKQIQQFPADVREKLFSKAKKLSALDEKEAKKIKKS